MRVIAGTARSLRLMTPNGQGTRPTTDRIKETLFNILNPYLADCVFVDLFSGSGGIAMEALSRGAAKAWLVENGEEACSCIRQNIKSTDMEECAVLLKQDVIAALSSIHEKSVDIIFMDPPYEAGYERRVLEKLAGQNYVTRDTILITEALLSADFSWAEELGYEITREKKYKTNKHVFMRKIKEDTF